MIAKTSGESLHLCLRHFGLHQQDLAKACGMAPPFINRLLRGKQTITDQARERLAQGLKDLITKENIL